MAAKTDIELALADLEAGKFSFRMVETIKNHVTTLEGDLARVSDAYESAGKTLLKQEYTIARLEAELRKVNARVHALVKANALTEAAVREGKHGALALRDLLLVLGQHGLRLSKEALAWLSTVDAQAEWKKLKAHPLTEKALSELQTASSKAQEYLPVAQKQAAALVEKASAFIADLTKKAA